MVNAEQKELLRNAALTFIAARPALSFSVSALARFIVLDQLVCFAFTESELVEALTVLEGFGLAVRERGALGASIYWRATSEGVLHYERAER